MADKVLIAKRDLYAEVDNGFGNEIKQLVAREGQEVPAALAHLVDEDDVTSEIPKTRSLVAGRSAADRRAAVDEEVKEPDHAAVRAAAGIVDPEEPAALPVTNDSAAEELREQLAEAEKRATDAEQRADTAEADKEAAEKRAQEAEHHAEEAATQAKEEPEAPKEKEAEVKPEKPTPAPKSRKSANDKARKPAADKARKSAKSK